MDLDLGSALSQLAAGLADGGGSDDGAPGAQKYADDSVILRDIEQVDKDGAKVRSSEEAEWQEAWNFYLGKHWNAWVNDQHLSWVRLATEELADLLAFLSRGWPQASVPAK